VLLDAAEVAKERLAEAQAGEHHPMRTRKWKPPIG
jgi:hypothetical protein